MAVLLYGGAEDIPSVFGKTYRNALRELGLGKSWFDALNSATAELNEFKRDHAEFLKEIRNYVGAHREQDAVRQLVILEKLGHMEVYHLAAKFSKPLRVLVTFHTALLHYMKHPGVLFQEAIKVANVRKE
jgi:hypothetical protein